MDSLPAIPPARLTAHACIRSIEAGLPSTGAASHSPLLQILQTVHRIEHDPAVAGNLWVINDRADSASEVVSPWGIWFRQQAPSRERPLIYLTQSPSSARVSMLAEQIGHRGIVFNDLESAASRWPKGAHPWLPLWLSANAQCRPYDPASAAEAQAILLAALDELYVQGRHGFYYMTLHDQPPAADEPAHDDCSDAFLGMYPLQPTSAARPQVRLLGAGAMLREVRAAAVLLDTHWGIASQLWSCPSYTRLARDSDDAARWNRLHPEAAPRKSYLQYCLMSASTPVIAVTGYAQHIADQLAPHVTAPFTALGADSLAPGSCLDRRWIAFSALQALAGQGLFDTQALPAAQARLGLGE
ncbi:transketolase-like TK C-terminal-containing protein [Pseudomonas qingdaonensis]|uniref:transketolase-like TK C-terminal-containing protein n=1 Tax=Pseudomonas qingdaonensis TaxID=2056231 RepID=UPI001F487A7C|nr:pyruvate dehydrogenase [Pseudomonas qingdaonensis]